MTATSPGADHPSVVVAGIGNDFLGDDGFGPAVARALATRPLPPGVRVVDAGTGATHLAFDLVDGPSLAILVDLAELHAKPGTLAMIRPESQVRPVGHGLSISGLLALMDELGGTVPEVRLVGCQPVSIEPGMGLSEPVAAAVEVACGMVIEAIGEARSCCVE